MTLHEESHLSLHRFDITVLCKFTHWSSQWSFSLRERIHTSWGLGLISLHMLSLLFPVCNPNLVRDTSQTYKLRFK